MKSCDLFIFVGEPSGDLHGEKVLKALLDKNPSLQVLGVGGPRMRKLGMQCTLTMEDFQVMGFIDVYLALPKLIRQFYAVQKAILKANPKVVLFIDYPGFNVRMANSLRKKKFTGKLCHYICPSVWAWGKKRIPQMAQNLDLLLTIFPFEASFFSDTSLSVKYVGHPLLKRIQDYQSKPLSIPKDKRLIALFPGSRKKEILRNFNMHLKVARELLKTHPDLIFGVSISHPRFLPLIQEILQKEQFQEGRDFFLVSSDNTYDLMHAATLAIAKSGTVTLELALHAVPTVVTYGVTRLDQFIATHLLNINLRYYCIVNIAADRLIFPELFGSNLTENNLLKAALEFLGNPTFYAECQSACRALRLELQDKDASVEVANHLQELGRL